MTENYKRSFQKFRWLITVFTGINLLIIFPCQAQVCNGSLGDPVVDITFGAGSPLIGTALDAGTTNYPFVYTSFPQDGFYTIENTTAGVGKDEEGRDIWWPVTDHTGNAGGYMMVVNANLSPTEYFYKHTVSGLCQGTTYEFAAWIVNLLPYLDISPPDIVFTISSTDGTVLGVDSTGQIPINTSRPEWIQYKLIFTTPPGVSSVVLKIRDISSGGGPANDLALDDITFRACGPLITTGFTGESAGASISSCVGNNEVYNLISEVGASIYTDPIYQWQMKADSGWQNLAGDTSLANIQVQEPLTVGQYAYRLVSSERGNASSPFCKVASKPVLLNIVSIGIKTLPVINIIEGKQTRINTVVTGKGLHFKWTPSTGLDNDTVPNPVASPLSDTEYKVVAISAGGCTASADVKIIVLRIPLIPTAFTPNGDGFNDTWEIAHIDNRPDYSMKIFNRYGQQVFSAADYSQPWDGTYQGKKVPSGVYYYMMDTHNALGILSGNLTVLY